MEYRDFIRQIKEDLPEHFSGVLTGAEVAEVQIPKLQGQSYEGIRVTPEGSNMAITMDMNPYFQMMENGVNYEYLLSHLAEELEDHYLRRPEFSMDMLSNYESIKDSLSVQLIGQAGNEAMLQNIPHRDIEDMAMVYRINLPESEYGVSSILVTNSVLEQYGITEEQLHQDAISSPRSSSYEIKTMGEVMSEITGMPMPDDMLPLFVASNQERYYGASVIVCPGFLEEAHQRLEGNFFVLPSSVHEVLLIPEEAGLSREELENMVRDVNASVVSPKEKLSDHIYHYDGKEKLFELADKYENRMNQQETDREASRPSVLDTLHNNKKDLAELPCRAASPIRKEEAVL